MTTEKGSTRSWDEEFEWLDRMNCKGRDIDDFDPPRGAKIDSEILEECRECEVRTECLTHAYGKGWLHIWRGGYSPAQLQSMTLAEALEQT